MRARKAAKILAILSDFMTDDLSEKSCLDVGCRDGIILKALSTQFHFNVGIDIESTSLPPKDWGEHSLPELGSGGQNREDLPPTHFTQANGKELPFPGEQFDLIICAQVYEHVDDPVSLVAEIRRVLKPHGIIFFSGPNRWAVVEEHYHLPFLSWLPKKLADRYMRTTKRGDRYEIQPLSYWQLRHLLCDFKIHDYAPKLLSHPELFALDERVKVRIPPWLGKLLRPWVPNFNWVLTIKDPKGFRDFPKTENSSNSQLLGSTKISEETLRVSAIGQSAYTQDYYLTECEGFEEFIETRAARISPRLARPMEIADIQPHQRILDIGSGRGELVLHSAQRGAFSWGLDYAWEALRLTKQLPRQSKMAFQQANAQSLPFASNIFDTIFMLDIVEHLSSKELKIAFQEVHRVLKPTGRLIIHTMPNLWYYRYGYPLFRWVQFLRGQEIPKDPRSRWRYAHLHVNEQHPLKIRNSLKSANFHTKIWLESVQDYSRESSPIVRLIMKSLTHLPLLKLIFCNDIFAMGTKK